ncbi:hypothetical protein ESCO_002551 [Escovopsis weberi]|uniref:14-3-3 domain-containing protein n=1 Tax=Escovopsis weberi TaxID=150374 RepID=A0A0M9VT26_ESCWE|nr:hypothetical protein ESCO_002551 [Escovopsis weberi]
MAPWDPEAAAMALGEIPRLDKGKGIAMDDYLEEPSFATPSHYFQGGPVQPPPGFEAPLSPMSLSFLLPAKDYLPMTNQYFEEAVAIADRFLWGSHSLRLSVKTEYAAFLYDCVHDAEGSRELARLTINEVYEATEGMDDDMFRDACELVTVLGKMMRRGLGSSNTLHTQAQGSNLALSTGATPPIGMENPI